MSPIIIFIIGIIVGFVVMILLSVSTKKTILIPTHNGDCFHLHHYVFMLPVSAILGILAYNNRYSKEYLWYLFGCSLFLGGSLTNFMYSDVFDFIQKCSDRNKCVVPFKGTWVGDNLKKLC